MVDSLFWKLGQVDVVHVSGFVAFFGYMPLFVAVPTNLFAWLRTISGDMILVSTIVAGSPIAAATLVIGTVFADVADW